MKRLIVIVGVILFLGLAACTGNDAREDLDVQDQTNDTSEAITAIFPDGFPNVSRKCIDFGQGPEVGIYTTTDRFVILAFNDPTCPGHKPEQPMTVINMGSRQAVSSE